MSWTRARHPETGNEAILPVSALPHLPYWEAVGEPAESQQDLLQQQEEARAAAVEAAVARAEDAAAATQDATVAEVLEAVAGDPVAARAALDAEQAKDHPRKTLVAALEDIITAEDDPAGDSATTEGA